MISISKADSPTWLVPGRKTEAGLRDAAYIWSEFGTIPGYGTNNIQLQVGLGKKSFREIFL